MANRNAALLAGTNGTSSAVPRFAGVTNGVVGGSNQTAFGVTTNQFGLLTNQMGMLTNQFGPTNLFGRFTNRFSMLTNRFGMFSNRFDMFSNRFSILSNRFRSFTNRFGTVTNMSGTNLVYRDEALTEQDRILVGEIRRELLPEIRRERAAIHLIARNGVVTIVGLVPSAEDEAEFVRIARGTPGVVDVINHMQIAFSMNGAPGGAAQGAAESPQGTAAGVEQGPPASQQGEHHIDIHASGTNVPATLNPVPPGSRPSLPSPAFPYSTNGIPPGTRAP
jgi:hypothetical protein